TVDEVVALSRWLHDREMFLHLDGARLSNAAAHLGVGLGAFGSAAGVDVLSYGATKNGAMGGEAIISFRPVAQSSLRFIRKQSMQLASKMRFVAAQFTALLTDDLWRDNAAHANEMAGRLATGVARIPDVTIAYPVEANGVFAVLPGDVTEALQRDYPFYVWDPPSGVVRWMASYDTTEQDVDDFVARLVTLMASHR
ncbi:MAG TPA: beta-eliminating lyase-related protein, partial [Acidimicrobiales bacterium]|nr:beta-eliminating lyase-related protein [Acidimicrobiales bacterium]